MGRVAGCAALLMLVTSCGYDRVGDVNMTALDCRHRDRDVCQLLTSISQKRVSQNGSAESHAKQVELDVSAMLGGTNR